MITSGPEFDNFEVKPGMELESFDMKQKDEIFLNHPFKILMFYLGKHPPYYSRWDGIDLCDFYFEMLDNYNRYGISFRREDDICGFNSLYVIENDNSKEDHEIRFKSKYKFISTYHYDFKTLLFNKVKKINLDELDKESESPSLPFVSEDSILDIIPFLDAVERINLKKPASEWELLEKIRSIKRKYKITQWEYFKRKTIREQKNKYLQVALMDPKVYNNDELFKELNVGLLDDFNGEFEHYSHLMFTDEKHEEYLKRNFKKIIDLLKNINYLINEGNSEYLGIIDD